VIRTETDAPGVLPQVCLIPETLPELAQVFKYFGGRRSDLVGFDTETTSRRWEIANRVGVSLAVTREGGIYVPVGHAPHATMTARNLPLPPVLEMLGEFLGDGGEWLVMANGKFDRHVLARLGIWLTRWTDSMSVTRLLGEVDYGVGLKPSVKRMYGEDVTEFTDIVKKGETFADVDVVVGAKYAVPDAVNTRRLAIDGLERLSPLSKKVMLRLETEAMCIDGPAMEWTGLPVDLEWIRSNVETGEAMLSLLRTAAVDGLRSAAARHGNEADVTEALNFDSPPQMQKVLFESCRFPVIKTSKKTGRPSADRATLEALAQTVPEVAQVYKWRSAEGMVQRLRDEWQDRAIPRDGWHWVHAGLNPTGTVTGRWSSSNPNLTNMPKGEMVFEAGGVEWKVRMRDGVCAPPGFAIVTADYSQVELRIAAGESGCSRWLAAFTSGDDVHAASAAAIYGLAIGDVTSSQRQVGKGFNFALLYGQESKSTASMLGISVEEAQAMQARFWSGLPEVKEWVDRVHAQANAQGYVETKFGRRRYLEVRHENRFVRLKAMRESVNTIVQGTAGDILKFGLVRQRPVAARFGARIFLVVHDQYVWLVPEEVSPLEFATAMAPALNVEVAGYPEIVSDFALGQRFGSVVGYSMADMPETFFEASSRAAERDVPTLVLEAGAMTQRQAEALRALFAPGSARAILRSGEQEFVLEGVVLPEELAIRAAAPSVRIVR